MITGLHRFTRDFRVNPMVPYQHDTEHVRVFVLSRPWTVQITSSFHIVLSKHVPRAQALNLLPLQMHTKPDPLHE